MDMNYPAWFNVIIVIGLALNVASGWLSGATARSKGFSFGLFFGLSFVSWLIMATIAVFIKQRDTIAAPDAVRKSLSRTLYFTGLGAYIVGPLSLSLVAGGSSQVAWSGIAWVVIVGAIGATLMGIGLIMASVVLAKNKSGEALQKFNPTLD
jgi:hypothetical protein